MRKVAVRIHFYDKHNRDKVYCPGDIVAFEDSRAAAIVANGLGEFVKEVIPEAKAGDIATAALEIDEEKNENAAPVTKTEEVKPETKAKKTKSAKK